MCLASCCRFRTRLGTALPRMVLRSSCTTWATARSTRLNCSYLKGRPIPSTLFSKRCETTLASAFRREIDLVVLNRKGVLNSGRVGESTARWPIHTVALMREFAFDTAVRRKPLAGAADAGCYGNSVDFCLKSLARRGLSPKRYY